MKFDILATFQHVVSGNSISGYVNEFPMEDTTAEDAQTGIDELQMQFGSNHFKYLTLFTRDTTKLFQGNAEKWFFTTPKAREVTVPTSILQNSVLIVQLHTIEDET